MNMRVMIVDDEPLALERLRLCLDQTPGVEIVGEASDGDQALELIALLEPDLVLLDIQMPGRSGVAVARAVSGRPRPEVVFVTAFAEFAPEAFDLEAADYLLKPVRFDRVQEAIRRAARRLELSATFGRVSELEAVLRAARPPQAEPSPAYDSELWIKQRDGFARVDVEQIRRIEAARDYVLLHTSMKTHILRVTTRLDPTHDGQSVRQTDVNLPHYPIAHARHGPAKKGLGCSHHVLANVLQLAQRPLYLRSSRA